jgi:hypothetical protein
VVAEVYVDVVLVQHIVLFLLLKVLLLALSQLALITNITQAICRAI